MNKLGRLLIIILCMMLVGCGDVELEETTKEQTGLEETTKEATTEETTTKEAITKETTTEEITTEETTTEETTTEESTTAENATDISQQIPDYSGKSYAVINDNVPFFTKKDMRADSYEYYSELDELGRCGVCIASIGRDIMPVEERGAIGMVKPTGWHTVKYNGVVDGNYLYNRCHLIGFQLTGENANTRNLITGTRSMNVDGMLPFENMVADYVKETDNHVMYRVTPIYEGDNLVATGVLMEAKSVEDDGDGILFNVFVYNVQDGISINYANGKSSLIEGVTTRGREQCTK